LRPAPATLCPFPSREHLSLLSAPRQWDLVASFAQPDVEPVHSPDRQRWLCDHCHAHAHGEILLALSGEGFHSLNGVIYPLSPGVLLALGPFETHDNGYRGRGHGEEHLWVSILAQTFVARLVRRAEGRTGLSTDWRALFTASDAHVLPEAFLGLWREGNADISGESRRTRLLGASALLASAIMDASLENRLASEGSAFQERVLADACEHIRQTAGSGISLDGLADIAGYSKYHFHRMFVRHVGMTVHQYIDQCRIERVRDLKHQGLTKQAISAALGFSAPSAFSRWERHRMSDDVEREVQRRK